MIADCPVAIQPSFPGRIARTWGNLHRSSTGVFALIQDPLPPLEVPLGLFGGGHLAEIWLVQGAARPGGGAGRARCPGTRSAVARGPGGSRQIVLAPREAATRPP